MDICVRASPSCTPRPRDAESLHEDIKYRYNATQAGVLPRELCSALASVAERHADRLDAELVKYLPAVRDIYGLVVLVHHVSCAARR